METDSEKPIKKYVYVPVHQACDDKDDEIDLLELWDTLWRGKWFICGFTLLCALIALAVVFYVLPVTYKSDAVLQPTETGSGDSMSKLAALASSIPLPIDIAGGDNKSQNIVSFLNSRTLKMRLIQEHHLLPRFYPDLWDAQKQQWNVDDSEDIPTPIKTLQDKILEDFYYSVSQDKETMLITISWVDEDPEFASEMLKHIIDKVTFYLENEYESDAERERKFVESRLASAEKNLEFWEQQIPSANLTLSKIQREHLAAQTVYTELRKQVELAKIAEVKEIIRFKTLDKPFVPEMKYKPKRTLICTLTIFISAFFSVIFILFWQFFANIKRNKLKISSS
ncbi:Wzz/FepE/Etk N-terminal domain-containing protein [Desulfocicer niacini]